MIRLATKSDIKNISVLIHKAWYKDLVGLVGQKALKSLTVEKFASQLEKEIVNDDEYVIVYEVKGEIVGYVSGNTKNKNFESEIVALYVNPKAQQSGVGSILFSKMQSFFKLQNKSTMIVWTLLDAPNNKFYQSKNPVKITHRDIVLSVEKYPGIGFIYLLG